MKTVAVILVSWNQKEDVSECLASLNSVRWENKKIIIVDNGSKDRTSEFIQDCHPEVTLLQAGSNIGFPAANNLGIRLALEKKYPYLFLLNTDTKVSEDIIDHLVEAMVSDPHLGIAGPKMYYYDDPDRIWFAGGITNPDTGISHHLRHGEKDLGEEEKGIVPCTFITGAGMFIHRDVFNRIGLFDESFFHTAEDNDFSVRARRAGFKLACVPQAKLWHKVKSTTGGNQKSTPLYTYYEFRNRLIFVKKHSRNRKWLKNINKTLYNIMRKELLLLVREKNPGAAIALAEGIVHFFRGRTGMLKG